MTVVVRAQVQSEVVPGTGLEPVTLARADFKSAVFTNFTTRAGGAALYRRAVSRAVGIRAGCFASAAAVGSAQIVEGDVECGRDTA